MHGLRDIEAGKHTGTFGSFSARSEPGIERQDMRSASTLPDQFLEHLRSVALSRTRQPANENKTGPQGRQRHGRETLDSWRDAPPKSMRLRW